MSQCGAGDLVSPLDRVDSRAVSIVADEPGRSLVLESKTRQWLEQHQVKLALKLYRYLFAQPKPKGET